MKSNTSTAIPLSNTGSPTPQIDTPTPLSLDWLSISCKRISPPKRFDIFERANYTTKVFNCIEFVSYNNIPYATLTSEPKSSILPPDTVIVKFENWILYQDYFFTNLVDLLQEWGLSYNKLNRLDIAVDIQNFANNLLPGNFIKGYFTGYYYKEGRCKFKAIGLNGSKLVYDYLRFGTGNSDISVYLYNKSKEMREVVEKEWIREVWNVSGMRKDKDVWRLEVSIKGDLTHILNADTGEIAHIDLVQIMQVKGLEGIFKAAIANKMRFRIKGKGTHPERWKRLVLFSKLRSIEHRTISINKRKDVTKMHKVTIKKMVELWDEIRQNESEEIGHIEKTILHFASERNLKEYLATKTEFNPTTIDFFTKI